MEMFNKLIAVLIAALLVSTLLSAQVCAAPEPSPSAEFYVNDFAGVLSDKTKDEIISKNNYFMNIKIPGAMLNIIVVTVNSTDGEDIGDYANTLINEWGLKAYNKGYFLLLISTDSKEYHCSQSPGLRYALSPEILNGIIKKNLIKKLNAGKYDSGVMKTFNAIYKAADSYSLAISIRYNIRPSFRSNSPELHRLETDGWDGGFLETNKSLFDTYYEFFAVLIAAVIVTSFVRSKMTPKKAYPEDVPRVFKKKFVKAQKKPSPNKLYKKNILLAKCVQSLAEKCMITGGELYRDASDSIKVSEKALIPKFKAEANENLTRTTSSLGKKLLNGSLSFSDKTYLKEILEDIEKNNRILAA